MPFPPRTDPLDLDAHQRRHLEPNSVVRHRDGRLLGYLAETEEGARCVEVDAAIRIIPFAELGEVVMTPAALLHEWMAHQRPAPAIAVHQTEPGCYVATAWLGPDGRREQIEGGSHHEVVAEAVKRWGFGIEVVPGGRE